MFHSTSSLTTRLSNPSRILTGRHHQVVVFVLAFSFCSSRLLPKRFPPKTCHPSTATPVARKLYLRLAPVTSSAIRCREVDAASNSGPLELVNEVFKTLIRGECFAYSPRQHITITSYGGSQRCKVLFAFDIQLDRSGR